jgi:hypothetical protein
MARENYTKHGMSKTKIYQVWAEMVNRATNPNHANARYYFDKGVTLCDEWKSFTNFYSDMGDKPEGAWLERVDNSGAYCKDNCKWETASRQCSNRGRKTNKSGRLGVYWAPDRSKWRVEIKVDKKRHHVGQFSKFEDACEAADKFEIENLGYSRADHLQ